MNIYQVTHQNPDATQPLIIPVIVLPNTPEEVGAAQIAANGKLDLPWFHGCEAHDGIAVICGGGPSLIDYVVEVADRAERGATVFGLNAAAGLLVNAGIRVDFQVILDAKEETSALVEPYANERLYASQVHPDTAAYATMLFHMANAGIEDLLPPERVEQGGYSLIGGGVSVGITALCLAHAMGFREFHLYGYDSSNRNTKTHAYEQRMNALIPTIDVTWGGKTYTSAMPMKAQAFAFPKFARALTEEGVKIEVHGDGLLPAMWSVPPATEQEKYALIWTLDDYRKWSPGEDKVETFLEVAKPDALVVDFGCGTGRAARKIAETGVDVLLIDFTDNCRDKDCMALPFLQWDLCERIPVSAPYGYCTDVMEHIPTEKVDLAIRNIMASAERVFFQIATFEDGFGDEIGQTLHLTVKDHGWWLERFSEYEVQWQEAGDLASCFYVKRKEV